MSQPFTLPQNASLCILRLSAIGDVCHAVAMVQRVQRARPDVSITWVIGKVEYQLVNQLPGITFVVFDKKAGKAGVRAVKEALGGQTFDALCIMQVALRANWLSRVIKAKVKIGFDKQRSKEGHSWFINRRIAEQTHPHVLDGFMAFADALGVEGSSVPQWDFPLSQQDRNKADALLQQYPQYAVISPAASKAERCWTAQGYAQIADHLHQRGLAVLLCGGPGPLDKSLAQAIAEHTANIAQVLVGTTSLKEQLAILQGAKLLVAPDTGPAHMATMVGTPVVGLYAHSNPRRTGPYNSADWTVSVYDEVIEEQTGKRWDELPWGARAKGETLMQRIAESDVINAIELCLGQ